MNFFSFCGIDLDQITVLFNNKFATLSQKEDASLDEIYLNGLPHIGKY